MPRPVVRQLADLLDGFRLRRTNRTVTAPNVRAEPDSTANAPSKREEGQLNRLVIAGDALYRTL